NRCQIGITLSARPFAGRAPPSCFQYKAPRLQVKPERGAHGAMLNGTNQWLAARRWRIYAALVLLAVLPLLLFLYSADRFLRKYTNDSLTRQSHVAGDAVARILLEYLASGEAFLSSVAAEPGFNVAAGRGDTKAMSGSLGQACRLQPDFTYCAVYDAQGRLLVAYPAGVRADAATP